jgi:hypothetical protein
MFEVIKEDLEEFEAKKKSTVKNGKNGHKKEETEQMDCMEDEEMPDDEDDNKSKSVKRKLDSKVS